MRGTSIALALIVLVGLSRRSSSSSRRRSSSSSSRLSRAELEELARDVGWPAGEVSNATTIALRESGGNPRAVLDTRGWSDEELLRRFPRANVKVRERSCGLYQINTLAWPYTCEELMNPRRATTAALEIWRKQGWGPWGGTPQ